MSEVHAQARTTPHTRAEIKESSASLAELAERYNISRATARKWKGRETAQDLSHRPHKCPGLMNSHTPIGGNHVSGQPSHLDESDGEPPAMRQ